MDFHTVQRGVSIGDTGRGYDCMSVILNFVLVKWTFTLSKEVLALEILVGLGLLERRGLLDLVGKSVQYIIFMY